jgi:putative transposase
MEKKNRKLWHKPHNVNLILYHLIFVAKYRHNIFTNTKFADELKQESIEISLKYDFEIDTIELDPSKPDHLHILVRTVPTVTPSQIVRVLKQELNIWAWSNYEQWLRKFYWNTNYLFHRGYFVSSAGNVSVEKIQEYLEAQSTNVS